MKVSERIIEWIERYDKLEACVGTLSSDIHEFNSYASPFSSIERTRAWACSIGQEGIMEHWDSLKQAWDECSGNLDEKFQALNKRMEKGDIPDFIKKLINEHYAFVSDKNRVILLFEQDERLESIATSFVDNSAKLGEELTKEANGPMVFSFEAEVKYDKNREIFGKNPITYVSHSARCKFPNQSLPDLAKRFLRAVHHDGFYYFKLSGMMNDEEHTSLKDALGEVGGETSAAEQIVDSVDLTNVESLWLLVSGTKDFPEYLFRGQKFERINLNRIKEGSIILGEDLSRRRMDCLKSGNECIRSLANIIDDVAENYRKE